MAPMAKPFYGYVLKDKIQDLVEGHDHQVTGIAENNRAN